MPPKNGWQRAAVKAAKRAGEMRPQRETLIRQDQDSPVRQIGVQSTDLLGASMALSAQSEPLEAEERALVRMNFRTKPRIKAAIQRAAALAGLDDSAFTMQAAYQAARAVISAHERTELQAVDHDAFFSALEQPAPATETLSAAFKRHQNTVSSC